MYSTITLQHINKKNMYVQNIISKSKMATGSLIPSSSKLLRQKFSLSIEIIKKNCPYKNNVYIYLFWICIQQTLQNRSYFFYCNQMFICQNAVTINRLRCKIGHFSPRANASIRAGANLRHLNLNSTKKKQIHRWNIQENCHVLCQA